MSKKCSQLLNYCKYLHKVVQPSSGCEHSLECSLGGGLLQGESGLFGCWVIPGLLQFLAISGQNVKHFLLYLGMCVVLA